LQLYNFQFQFQTFKISTGKNPRTNSPTIMGASPFGLIIYTLAGSVLHFHQLTSYLKLRLDAAFYLSCVLVILLFGSIGYLFADSIIGTINFIYTLQADNSAFSEKWWLTWIRPGTAGIAGAGMLAYLMYGAGGSWRSAKQNFSVARDRAEEVRRLETEKEKVTTGAWLYYSVVLTYSKAVFDFALWAMETFKQRDIEQKMVQPLWCSLGPFAVVGTVALSRSGRAKGNTLSPRTEPVVTDVEKLVIREDESMT
jgi:hypothetical protein